MPTVILNLSGGKPQACDAFPETAPFHARDAQPFNLESLTAIPLEELLEMRFELAASCQLIYSPFPIFEIWRVNQPGYTGDHCVDLDAGEESVLLTRASFEVELHRLETGDARFLQSLAGDSSLEQAVEAALKFDQAFNLELALTKYLGPGALIPTHRDSSKTPHNRHISGGK